MTLLERFRAQARDKHPDPAVRLAFVHELPLSDRSTIAAMAREDQDPRVRKAAVAKLMAPSELVAIARDDADDGVRASAAAMLRDIALEAFQDAGESESLEAVDAIADPRTLAQVAKSTTREAVALRATERIEDAHLFGTIARHALVDAARARAFAWLRERGDRAEILAVAMNSDFKDTAIAAVDCIGDRMELDQIIARSRNKSAVKRARAIVREVEEQSAREAAAAEADRVALEEAKAREAAAEADRLASEAAVQGDAAREQADEARRLQEELEAAERARLKAEKEAERQAQAARDAARRHDRLNELVEQAVAAAAEETFASARHRFAIVRHEWHDLAAGISVEPLLAARFAAIDAAMTGRENEAHEAEMRARREASARLRNLLGRVEPLAAKSDVTLKAADRALRDVRAALGTLPTLLARQDFEDVARRLKAAQAALTLKVQELREADEWRRFGNVGVQEQLCACMEALRSAEDLEAAAREVHELQRQWREAADVPRAKADALWRRFKAAHDEVWARCESHFAAQATQRAENLARKIELCEKAESLAESTNWIQAADEIKKLQAEWKTIGHVPRGKEKAIWDRFIAACDRFFTRRHEDLAQRKALWAENLAKKDALCARAEALADSTDWDHAAAEFKKLQAEWKTIGPVKRSKSDAIWHRFRTACDCFFVRYARRHDTARAAHVAAREALCATLESLAGLEDAPADLATTTRDVRGQWQQEIAVRGIDPEQARALEQRFSAALSLVLVRWPAAFAGTDLDLGANARRMEALVRRMEDLAASLGRSGAGDELLSPTTRLAAMLKEALAANTIGGKVDEDSRVRAAVEDVHQAQVAWSRIGLVPEDARRQLTTRFQRAIRAITDWAGGAGSRSGGDRSKGPSRPQERVPVS